VGRRRTSHHRREDFDEVSFVHSQGLKAEIASAEPPVLVRITATILHLFLFSGLMNRGRWRNRAPDAAARILIKVRNGFPLPFHETDVLIDGEVGEAFHTPAWQRPLDLDPVNLGALADAQHYARIVRGQITSRSRLEMGPLQVSGLPGINAPTASGFVRFATNLTPSQWFKPAYLILEQQGRPVVNCDQHITAPSLLKSPMAIPRAA